MMAKMNQSGTGQEAGTRYSQVFFVFGKPKTKTESERIHGVRTGRHGQWGAQITVWEGGSLRMLKEKLL
jgi:hypothetical protein